MVTITQQKLQILMPVESQNSILVCANLRIGYPKLVVASDINLTVSQGKLIGILGLNGSGKSTLLRSFANMQAALDGEILIQEKNIKDYSQHNLAQEMAVVLTEKLPESLVTVNEMIAMGRMAYTNWLDQLSPIDKEKIDFAIRVTHTEDLLEKQFSELSDGQRQKVLIAKAIAQDTKLIFLDEPTAHLDVHHQMETFALLKDLAHNYHKTVILATHEVGLATQLADELWLIHNKTLQIGSPKELIDNNLIEDIFNSDLIRFNAKTSTFEYK